jgi:hypothetical protein
MGALLEFADDDLVGAISGGGVIIDEVMEGLCFEFEVGVEGELVDGDWGEFSFFGDGWDGGGL